MKVALLLIALQAFAQDSWPQFRGNPQNTGIARSTLPATLKVLWTYEAGDPIDSSAAIVDGVVYVGCQSGDLLAIDLATGKLKWKYRATANGIGESSPAVADGVVYIGDLDGVFHAVDAASGKARWTFKTGAEIKSSPVVAGDRVLIGSYDGSLYCLKDGKQLWRVRTENYVHGTPALFEGVAYISGCDEIVRAIRLTDGSELYQFPSGGYTGASPSVVNGVAYYGTFANDVIAASLKAKKIVWRFAHPQRKFPFYSSPAVTQGKVFVGGRDKYVYGFDAATGKPAWSFATKARVDSSPAVAGDRVFIGSNDGRVYGFDVAKGGKVWEYEIGSGVTASPAIAQGRMVVGAQDGQVYCFGN